MNKKMAVGLTLVFVGGLAVGIAVPEWKVDVPVHPEIEAAGITPIRIIASHDDSGKLYRIDAEYPQFGSMADAFNRSITEYVDMGIEEFKGNAEGNWRAHQDTMSAGAAQEEYPPTPYTFSATWEPKQINNRYVSIIIRLDAYEGGANARRELRTFNYDVANGRGITLEDLFPSDRTYLGKVSKYAYDRLVEDLTTVGGGDVEVNMIAEGTRPMRDNFKNFVFDEYVIDLYFPKYQVAPGVFGEQHVVVPRSGL